MCVKIVSKKSERLFNAEIPLEKQIKGCKQIVVDFKPNDPQLEKFLDEVERLTRTGVTCNLNIKVVHNDNILGAKIKKQTQKLQKGLTLNDLIKLLVLTYDKTDRTLEEISNMCNYGR